jgi:hypothetical protein
VQRSGKVLSLFVALCGRRPDLAPARARARNLIYQEIQRRIWRTMGTLISSCWQFEDSFRAALRVSPRCVDPGGQVESLTMMLRPIDQPIDSSKIGRERSKSNARFRSSGLPLIKLCNVPNEIRQRTTQASRQERERERERVCVCVYRSSSF